MKHTLLTVSLGAALLLAGSCATEPASYVYGIALDDVEMVVDDPTIGVYPSTAVLDSSFNPFAETGIGSEDRWMILDAGAWPATFYAWATWLTQEPTGEAQFYAATAAHQVYDRRDIDTDQLYYARQVAVDGYTSVLLNFPDSVTFDATGEIAYPLAPLAFDGIEALGATVEGFTKVTSDDGTVVILASE